MSRPRSGPSPSASSVSRLANWFEVEGRVCVLLESSWLHRLYRNLADWHRSFDSAGARLQRLVRCRTAPREAVVGDRAPLQIHATARLLQHLIDRGRVIPYSVRYDAVNAMLLNEFLKEHRKVDAQGATIAQVKSTAAKQEAIIAQQQKQIEALTAGLQKVSAQLELGKPAP
jgi:uncharacterized coiled-coil protein SlyX